MKMIGPHKKLGPPVDARRAHYRKIFGIRSHIKSDCHMTQALMDQLDRCQSPAARRILMGVSR